MNQPLYNDLLNASLILVAQKNNRQKVQGHKNNITLRNQIRDEMAALDDKPKGYGALMGWGVFLLIVSVIWLVIVFPATASDPGQMPDPLFYIIAIPIVCFAFLLSIAFIILARVILAKHKKDNKILMEKLRQEDEAKNQADEAAIAQLEADAVTLQKAAKELLAFLPETYRTSEAACYMLLAVKDGRADTLKEAMNLYEEQLHRWKMEKLAANSARMQQIHMATMQSAMQEIANNQQQIQDQLSAMTALQITDMMRDA